MKNNWLAIIRITGLASRVLLTAMNGGSVGRLHAGLGAASGSVWGSEFESPARDAPLPPGVKAVWDLDKAYRENTPTRERVCLNGLWRWQPAKEVTDTVPADNWGYFKIPGFWPGDSNYIQEDCQTLHVHPSWKDRDLRTTTVAWYQREITVPQGWDGRRIVLSAEYLNSFAIVYVDGKTAGEVRFPSG